MKIPPRHGRPLSQVERDYLSQVEQLVEGCLHRIQHYELPDDAEPPTVHWPSND